MPKERMMSMMKPADLRPGQELRFHSTVEVPCACGQLVRVGSMSTMDGADLGPVVAHEMPFCEDFDRLEPLEFLQWLRVKKGMADA